MLSGGRIPAVPWYLLVQVAFLVSYAEATVP